MSMLDSLTVGARVRWTSMSQGHTKTKEGVIEAVIPAGGHPRVYPMVPRNQLFKFGGERDHESYLVRVRKNTFYWPRVKNLAVVKDDLSAADRKAIKQGLADSAAGRVQTLVVDPRSARLDLSDTPPATGADGDGTGRPGCEKSKPR